MKKLGILILIICILFIAYGLYNGLEVTHYTYSDKELPKEFDGFRIAFVSDLHCKMLGEKEKKLIHAITSLSPDIVVFTGDMIDGNHKDITPVKDLLSGLSGKYPMFAVSGNHEKDILQNYEKLLAYYMEFGVYDLDDASFDLSVDGAHIGIYGISYRDSYYIKKLDQKPNKFNNKFNILLYHDATVFPQVSFYGYNLVISGHTHGGIIRLPFLGGLISNNISFFSDYDNGVYHMNDSTLISNRGIGDAFVPRFYNRPEVVCVTLRTEN